MGTACKNTNFHGSKTDFLQRRILSAGKRNQGYKKQNKTGSTDFSSAANTCQKYEVHSHMAIAHCSYVIVNTAAAVTLLGSHAYTLLRHVLAEKR